ncbi:MAG: proline--tRNA ligase [Candidatus Thermoplasmatota archaeon]|nr:proline--tRNA ligase [Candidatus Thermoplasmatota archaeon]
MIGEEEFSERYSELIERAEISDKRYPIKGMNVWLPYGWKLMLNIDNLIREELDKKKYREVMFPALITKEQFSKEKGHIKGFDAQVYWVTKGGTTELESPLLLRPTSETAMYSMFSLWIRSHADLPLKLYQLVNVYRYETKQTRSFIRVREIHFFEAHTCHDSFEQAEEQIKEYFEIIKKIMEKLCIPYLATKRPDWDKFPGAYYSIGFDTLMPTGKTLQVASVHQYKENFSKVYNIKYETVTGEHKYVHQTTYGMSERLVGAIIGLHSDERGLALPPAIAPIQVVIVPIHNKQERILKEADSVKRELESNNFRVELDSRAELTPGSKFYYWELRGVPLRIELGARELAANEISFVKRTSKERIVCKRDKLVESARALLRELEEKLSLRAKNFLENNIKSATSIEELSENAIYKVLWCGEKECALELESRTNFKTLGLELAVAAFEKGEKCLNCSKPAKSTIYLAKTY